MSNRSLQSEPVPSGALDAGFTLAKFYLKLIFGIKL
jgi:hypothetical protein